MLYARRLILPLLLLLVMLACKPADNTPPYVISAYPADGATGVPTNAQIRVTFSEPMDTAAVEVAFGIAPATVGSLTWASDSVIYWKPAQHLAVQTEYSYTVETGATDLSGRGLSRRLSVSFTTGDDTAAFAFITMCGRSVMGGWFSHWGSDPYTCGRFTLGYHEVPSPPDIATRVCAWIDSLLFIEEPPVLFFKLCFVDFVGGDSATAQENLDRNFGYVEQVYDAARSRGMRMIAGNALPQLANATDQWLVWNHRQYNQRLLALAAQHPDSLAVFDMYAVLADSNGNLRPDYASGPDDSHPNDAGYVALDSAFFPFLEEHY